MQKFYLQPRGTIYSAITDQMLSDAFENYLTSGNFLTIQFSKVISDELKMDLSLPPRDRISNLLQQMEELIHRHRCAEVLRVKKAPKTKLMLSSELWSLEIQE